jgi:hypothetical protein
MIGITGPRSLCIVIGSFRREGVRTTIVNSEVSLASRLLKVDGVAAVASDHAIAYSWNSAGQSVRVHAKLGSDGARNAVYLDSSG